MDAGRILARGSAEHRFDKLLLSRFLVLGA